MTKQEIQTWVEQIPDDIVEKAYTLDPCNKLVQLEYSNEIIKKYLLESPISFDPNGFISIEQPYGMLIFT